MMEFTNIHTKILLNYEDLLVNCVVTNRIDKKVLRQTSFGYAGQSLCITTAARF